MKWNENSSRSKWVHGFQVSGVVPGPQQMKEQSTDCLESQYTPSEILHRCSNSLYRHIFPKTKLDGRVQSLKLMLQHSWPSHTRPAVWRWESWQSVNFLKPCFSLYMNLGGFLHNAVHHHECFQKRLLKMKNLKRKTSQWAAMIVLQQPRHWAFSTWTSCHVEDT